MWNQLQLFVSVIYCAATAIANNDVGNYSFSIDYENNQFLLDGKPFRYVSGSFHYFRAPKDNWRDILRKMRAAGLNAVTTYVEWSLHEPEPHQWVWDGDADLIQFIKTAEAEDLFVILRPGPYICAERDFGGLPYWLLKLYPDIKIRTKDERYIFFVERYIGKVLEKVKPLLRGNGGPVIKVQIENEYGSYYSCDDEYKSRLYEIFNRYVGNDAVLYTTDGPTSNMLRCGSIAGVYATIDFGVGTNVKEAFTVMRRFSPRGPLVNSEFYPGWLTHWGENQFQRVDAMAVRKTLNQMLLLNASVNFYMFYGGTNFGFSSGANIGNSYWPQTTSYDYDAPLNEAGEITPKYSIIRRVISKHLPIPNITISNEVLKESYGTVQMTPVLDLFTAESRELLGTPLVQYSEPPSFEYLGLSHWIALYEADMPNFENSDNLTLYSLVRDRALIYIDGKLEAALNRMNGEEIASVSIKSGQKIKFLVENLGRVNYGSESPEDFKGIFNVKLNDREINQWNVTGFKLSSLKAEQIKLENTVAEFGKLTNGPQISVGSFVVEGEPRVTYLNPSGWGKGVAYVNGNNLGRYWPSVGPQVTLYVPATFLKTGNNEVVLIELENIPTNRSIELQSEPILG
ncbi:hypothetical protein QAD02_005795 [Eretmocerus hayati]|uniref:Uncharacterized protein n=1 Tax=Eretmocerus hayati TaxID=131215 RepID=A0ACC2NUI5_9HYME|nr:hypothetical protein QAD02_005795 [Eretmocerus hayati]